MVVVQYGEAHACVAGCKAARHISWDDIILQPVNDGGWAAHHQRPAHVKAHAVRREAPRDPHWSSRVRHQKRARAIALPREEFISAAHNALPAAT